MLLGGRFARPEGRRWRMLGRRSGIPVLQRGLQGLGLGRVPVVELDRGTVALSIGRERMKV